MFEEHREEKPKRSAPPAKFFQDWRIILLAAGVGVSVGWLLKPPLNRTGAIADIYRPDGVCWVLAPLCPMEGLDGPPIGTTRTLYVYRSKDSNERQLLDAMFDTFDLMTATLPSAIVADQRQPYPFAVGVHVLSGNHYEKSDPPSAWIVARFETGQNGYRFPKLDQFRRERLRSAIAGKREADVKFPRQEHPAFWGHIAIQLPKP